MQAPVLQSAALRSLTRDGRLLFGTRVVRLFAYGSLSVVLFLYLKQVGLDEQAIGVLFSLTLLGDLLVSLWMTVNADRLGRKRMLIGGAGLMLFAGIVFAATSNVVLLVIAATIGVISPGGNEVGPFLPIEQAALSQTVPDRQRTQVFAWYNLAGSFATAIGALCSGTLAQALQAGGTAPLASYRVVVLVYSAMGVVLALMFSRLGPAAEAAPLSSPQTITPVRSWLGLHRSRRIVANLSVLFALDSFGGALVLQSIVAYWFYLRFGVEPGLLGLIFFGTNIVAGLSALAAARVARRIGLINTMVFTHIPSNVLMLLIPLMPNLPLAIGTLLLRNCLSQMDVPPRQSYVMAVVGPDERSAAAGVTGVGRTLGASIAPLIAGPLMGNMALISVPFFLAGSIKIIYDLLLYRGFRAHKPPEEQPPKPA
jgi:MFS family permease